MEGKVTYFSANHSVQNILTDIIWMQVYPSNKHVKKTLYFFTLSMAKLTIFSWFISIQCNDFTQINLAVENNDNHSTDVKIIVEQYVEHCSLFAQVIY